MLVLDATGSSDSGRSETPMDQITRGVSGRRQLVNGLADYDQNGLSDPVAVLKAPIADSYVAGFQQGRATGSLTVTTSDAEAHPLIAASAASFNVSYYRINSSQVFVLQTDNTADISGYLLQQFFP